MLKLGPAVDSGVQPVSPPPSSAAQLIHKMVRAADGRRVVLSMSICMSGYDRFDVGACVQASVDCYTFNIRERLAELYQFLVSFTCPHSRERPKDAILALSNR